MLSRNNIDCYFLSLLPFYQGVQGTNITIKVLCSMMADASLGEPYHRYAAVARLMMDIFSLKCLDTSFSSYLKDMTNTSWEGPAAGGGVCVCVFWEVEVLCMFVHVSVREGDCGYLTFSILKCSSSIPYFSVLGNFLVHSI